MNLMSHTAVTTPGTLRLLLARTTPGPQRSRAESRRLLLARDYSWPVTPVAIACRLFYRVSHNVRETSKTNKGVWKETTESSSTLQFTCVAIGKRHKSGKSPPGPTTSDSDAMPKTEKVNSANSK